MAINEVKEVWLSQNGKARHGSCTHDWVCMEASTMAGNKTMDNGSVYNSQLCRLITSQN
jgi:hypothetical protein